MLLIDCPNCGRRAASEFRFGDVYHARPRSGGDDTDGGWFRYLYMRPNVMGVQTEWWNHRYGCGLWFLAERHTRTNQVLTTRRWAPDAVPTNAHTPSGPERGVEV